MNKQAIIKGFPVEVGRTDWERLVNLSERDLDAAIASDPDTFCPTDEELSAALHARSPRVRIRVGRNGRYYLSSPDRNGRVSIAGNSKGFVSRAKAKAALAAAHRAGSATAA